MYALKGSASGRPLWASVSKQKAPSLTTRGRTLVTQGSEGLPTRCASVLDKQQKRSQRSLARVQASTEIPSVSKREDNESSDDAVEVQGRVAFVERKTKETSVFVKINIDGTGKSDCVCGVPFLEHMLDQIASHGLFDIEVKAEGDIWIDDHHTTEDIALAFGQCLSMALGTRAGIYRFGDFSAPLDEALVHVVMVSYNHLLLHTLAVSALQR